MAIDTLEIVFIVASAVSAAASVTILLTAAIFREMRQRVFMQIIIFLAFSDLIASIASSFGFPNNSSILCPLQSALTAFFYHSSWYWTVILTHELYSIVMFGRMGFKTYQMHAICWSTAAICTLLPLASTHYGRDDDANAELAWCYLTGRTTVIIIWVSLTLYLPLFSSIGAMLFFCFRIHWKYRKTNVLMTNPDVHSTVNMLWLFPLAMILNWTPNLVMSVLTNTNLISSSASSVQNIFNAVTILATQNGTFSAIIFFAKSQEARFRWKHMFLTGSTTLNNPNDVLSDFKAEDSISSNRNSEVEKHINPIADETDYIRFSDVGKDVGLRPVAITTPRDDTESNDDGVAFSPGNSSQSRSSSGTRENEQRTMSTQSDDVGWSSWTGRNSEIANSPFHH